MGVRMYTKGDKKLWRIDTWVTFPDGHRKRVKKANIPSKEMALALENKMHIDAFENRFFDRVKPNVFTVEDAMDNYKPVSDRHRSFQTERNIMRTLKRHFKKRPVMTLTVEHVDQYRAKRWGETTKAGTPPKPATLDREVEFLKRILNYATECGKVPHNPIARVKLLRQPNVRRVIVDEEDFERLYRKAEEPLRPLLLVAYETGMRKQEVLNLRWNQVRPRAGLIKLEAQDTKTNEPRTIIMTDRVREAVLSQPRSIRKNGHVFLNPATGKRWVDIKKMFNRAKKAAKMEELWFHDLRRSFVTNARKRGIPESIVMQMSGHKTREVFARYNIIVEQDLRNAIEILQRGRDEELRLVANEGADG